MKNGANGRNHLTAGAPGFFIGRDRELAALKAWIDKSSPRPMAVTGPAGIGKTTLAQKFAKGETANGRDVVWINQSEFDDEITLEYRIKHLGSRRPGLLIVDEIEGVESLRQAMSYAGKSPLLFITRDASLGDVGDVLQLEGLGSRESAELVNALMPSAGPLETRTLVEGLEGSPMAITLASRLAKQPQAMRALLASLEGMQPQVAVPGGQAYDSRRTAQAGRALYEEAAQLLRQGDLQAAVMRLRGALATLSASLGIEHPDTLAVKSELGRTLAESGNAIEALAVLQDVVLSTERSGGRNSHTALRAKTNLAEGLRRSGDLAASYSLLDSVVLDMVSVLGEHHPEVLSGQANLAVLVRDMGDHPKALAIQDRVVRRALETYGPNHPFVLGARSNFAAMLEDSGDVMQSIAVQQSVVQDSERILGPEHPDTLLSVHNLASSLSAIGTVDESLLLESKVYEISKRTLGLRDSFTLSALNNLLVAYLSLEKQTEALALLHELLADQSRQKRYGDSTLADLCEALTTWAGSAIQGGQFDLANDVLHGVLELSSEWPKQVFPNFSARILELESQLHIKSWSSSSEPQMRLDLTVKRLVSSVVRGRM